MFSGRSMAAAVRADPFEMDSTTTPPRHIYLVQAPARDPGAGDIQGGMGGPVAMQLLGSTLSDKLTLSG
jgi:hypothetical protein